MNKVLLRKITELASFVFEDKDYIKFLNFIISKNYGRARILLERTIISLEMKTNDLLSTSILKQADELENFVMELIIDEMEDEGRKIKHITG